MSVFRADVTVDPQAVLAGHDDFGLVGFPARHAREAGLSISMLDYDGKPFPSGGSAHLFVLGNKTHGTRKKLRAGSEWVVRPPGWDDVAIPP